MGEDPVEAEAGAGEHRVHAGAVGVHGRDDGGALDHARENRQVVEVDERLAARLEGGAGGGERRERVAQDPGRRVTGTSTSAVITTCDASRA